MRSNNTTFKHFIWWHRYSNLKCATNIWIYHRRWIFNSFEFVVESLKPQKTLFVLYVCFYSCFYITVLLLLIKHDLCSFLYFYQEKEEATRKQVHLWSWKINVFLHYSDLSLISAFEAQKTKICFLTSIWDPEIYMCFRISLICLS